MIRNGRFAGAATLFLLACAAPPAASIAQERARDVRDVGQFPQRPLPDFLLNAQPAPMPPEDAAPLGGKSLPGSGGAASIDLRTGETRTERDGKGLLPPPEGDDPGAPGDPTLYPEAPGPQGRAPKASALIQVGGTTAFPYRTAAKIWMHWAGNPRATWSTCTAETAGSFHMLTAGHCVFTWDRNNDGVAGDTAWADQVIVYPAMTDIYAPSASPEFPYGEAFGVFLRTYADWTQNRDYEDDWGVITLDRRLGDWVGWMGRTSDVPASLNYGGYPAEAAYGWAGNLFFYRGYDSGNVTDDGGGRITMDALVYGGMSGGPVWRYNADAGERHIAGVNSTSDRAGTATATQLTDGKRSDLNAYIGDDAGVRPPADRPYVSRYNESYADVKANVVARGGTLGFDYDLINQGYAPSGTLTVDFYLSTDVNVASSDLYIGTRTLGSLAPWSYYNPSDGIAIPSSTPLGTYYLGWIVSDSVAEYGQDGTAPQFLNHSAGVVASETVQIIAASTCAAADAPDGARASWGALAAVAAGLYALRRRTASR